MGIRSEDAIKQSLRPGRGNSFLCMEGDSPSAQGIHLLPRANDMVKLGTLEPGSG